MAAFSPTASTASTTSLFGTKSRMASPENQPDAALKPSNTLASDPAVTVLMPPEKPLRREMKFINVPQKGLGISMCAFFGKIFITDVAPGGLAWNMGLKAGDRIDEVNRNLLNMGLWETTRVKQIIDRSREKLKIVIADQPIAVTVELYRSKHGPSTEHLADILTFLTLTDLRIIEINEKSCVDVTKPEKLLKRIIQSAQKNAGAARLTMVPKELAFAIQLAYRTRIVQELDDLTRNFYTLTLS